VAAQPGDDFLAGIDPVSVFGADVEAEFAVEVERQMIGDVSNWKPEGLGPFAAGSLAVSGSFDIEWQPGSEAFLAGFFAEPDDA
jgi:hypothetical protein